MPNQSDPNQNKPPTSAIPTVADLPPLPPEFQKVGSEPQAAIPPKSSGSAGPTNEKVSTISSSTINPRKKFGGGRIIATILGILLLVGGVGAGLILTQQRQDIREKASYDTCAECRLDASYQTCVSIGACEGTSGGCVRNSDCGSGQVCQGGDCVDKPEPEPEPTPYCSSFMKQDCALGCEPTLDGGDCKDLPAPTPYCSSFMKQDCAYGCTPTLDGGDCKDPAAPTPYCTSFMKQDCALGCEPTLDGGQCKPNPAAVGAGGTCTSSFNCQSGLYCINGKCGTYTQTGTECTSEVKCDQNGCTVGSKFDGSTSNCAVFKYKCPNDWQSGVSCDESTGGTFVGAGQSATFSGCGTEQIDVYCPACGQGSGELFVSKFNQGSCVTPGDGGNISAQCLNVKAYSTTWTLLTSSQLSALKKDDAVNFCVTGSTTGQSFDKAQFKINTELKAETLTTRPGSSDYCQHYIIKATDTTINVQAKIHHITLGWRGESI